MVVKKKILKETIPTRSEYDKQAKICPQCGYEGDNGEPPKRLPSPNPIYWDANKTIYACTKCGCQWEVANYRNKFSR